MHSLSEPRSLFRRFGKEESAGMKSYHPNCLHGGKKLFQDMVQLNGERFDRCLTLPNAIGQLVLCAFSDASEKALGACAYARWQLSTGGFNAQFIAAKSRVAPLKKLTIPPVWSFKVQC